METRTSGAAGGPGKRTGSNPGTAPRSDPAARAAGRAVGGPGHPGRPGAVEVLLNTAGEIDVLVANAALPAAGLLADYSVGEIEDM